MEVLPTLTGWQRAAPAITLLLLSPIVANVLFGAIRITFIFAVLPAATVWGLGALIIRELGAETETRSGNGDASSFTGAETGTERKRGRI